MTVHQSPDSSSSQEADVSRWLALLRDGSEDEQQTARTELGLILEARGLLDDAADAYVTNAATGVRDRRPYERLAAIARMRGDAAAEAHWLRALADVLAPPRPAPAAPAPDARPGPPDAGVANDAPAASVLPAVAPTSVPLAEHPEEALTPSKRRRRDGQPTGQPTVQPRQPEDEDPGVALHHVLEMDPEEHLHPHQVEPGPVRRSSAGGRRTVVLLAMLVPIVVVVGAVLAWQGALDLVESPPPAASPTDLVLGSPQLSSPRATVESRLVGSLPSPSPLSSPSATQPPRPTPTPTQTPMPLAARCSDAGLRFPETRDPEGAVREAYRTYLSRQGVSRDGSSTLFAGLGDAYVARSGEVVAGWMAVTLQREERGLPSFPLADYVASDVIVATGPNEYQLRATISPQGWTEIRAWPIDTCEGAFMRTPANARWVDLMQASVGDITWALPTPRPSR